MNTPNIGNTITVMDAKNENVLFVGKLSELSSTYTKGVYYMKIRGKKEVKAYHFEVTCMWQTTPKEFNVWNAQEKSA